MEGLSVSSMSLYNGLKGYWRRRRGYERLNGSGRRRFWKINVKRKLKVKVGGFSPKKCLMNLRDGYVNMMMKMANSSSGFDSGFGMRQLKEYDEKVLVQIYKSNMLIVQGHLVPRVVVGTHAICQQ